MSGSNDPPDFPSWVEANGDALMRFAYLVIGDHERAADAVQDALVAACQLSSRLVTGAAARQAATAIQSAPEGQGPDDPTSSESDGAEIVVLRIKTADGTREVVVRYSGGARNGFDDGTTRHELTTDSARPLLTGATSPSSLSLAVATLLGN
ncbi:MAG: hypothetical protein WBA97_01450 [Actinophytocola sp.]|uniref:hypothetical protein n=1 Tax=Actinophytocola sp. TaxID=1872138 RepID=UPI003C7236C2